MGYEDVRVKGNIKDTDRCGLCGLLCSVDLFIETKCYHLFCAECFEGYLKRNGHSGEIRDESNYTRPYNPVRCPVSALVLQHKHSRGALYLKMKQYFRLSQYRIKCEFYPLGCHTELKASRLAHHRLQCFFTARRVRDELDRDHLLFQPDYTNNNLYDVRLRTEPIEHLMCKRNNRMSNTPVNRVVNVRSSNSGDDSGGSFVSNEGDSLQDFKKETNTNSAMHNLIDLRSESAYESIDEQLGSERESPGNHQFKRITGSLMSASSVDLASNEQMLFDCLMAKNASSSTSSLRTTDDFDELKRQLELIQKNVNFIKQQLLPSYED